MRRESRAVHQNFPVRIAIRRAIGAAILFFIAVREPALAQESAGLEKLRVLSLELVNKSRMEHKLPPLQIDKKANEAARVHAADMLKRGFFDHNSPEGKTVGDRFVKAGGSRWRLTAENIARCTGCEPDAARLEEFHRGWMNSNGHRENILRKGMTQFGFAIVAAPGRPVYAVQIFNGPGLPNGLGPNEQPKRLSDAEVVTKALELLNKERKQNGRPAFVESPALTKAARALLPQKSLENFSLAQINKIRDRLPAAERGGWQGLTTLAIACGGCGGEPTDIDVRSFVRQWLADPKNKERMLNPATTHLGFALAANGNGKKVALSVLGERQAK
jgi:uncharacterized protein YkwD